ncbi:MAG: hypothetical protein OXN94_11825 [Chloroflexota bacterium]|nr:hypothetical protein [Chloroflexota bacterium]MDE2951465.1 hypothetical protein [Chloroflexota bacterium]
MKRLDLLLKIIAAADGEKVTPAQLQKVAFLVGMEFPHEVPSDYYEFQKYDYGPFSADVYRDAEQLDREGKITISVHSRGGWKEYAATVRGSRIDLKDIPVEMKTFIEDKVSWARGLSFQQLVREVYIQFPEYRENSAFQY